MKKVITLIFVLLFALSFSCSNSDDSGSDSGGNCIQVREGDWLFMLNDTVMGIGGDMEQKGCTLSFDLFNDSLDGSHWEASQPASYQGSTGTLVFDGNFIGDPAEEFDGVWKFLDSSGNQQAGSTCEGEYEGK